MFDFKIDFVESVTAASPARTKNEDACVFLPGACMVLDGATGLADPIMSAESDGHWLVNELAFRALQPSGNPTFEDRLRHAVASVASSYSDTVRHVAARPFDMPSAGMVAVEWNDRGVRLFQIGDCTVLLRRDGDIFEMFEPSSLGRLDAISIAELQSLMSGDRDAKSAREQLLPTLRRHRSQMNVAGGYGVLSTTVDCLDWLQIRSLDVQQGDEILLATDGFMAATDSYALFDRDAVFDHLAGRRGGEIIRKMRDAERSDQNLDRYPRLKQYDDATALLIRVVHR